MRAYVGPERNDWSEILDVFALEYNTSTHSVTKFTPSFLLFGFQPITRLGYLAPPAESVPRFEEVSDSVNSKNLKRRAGESKIEINDIESWDNKKRRKVSLFKTDDTCMWNLPSLEGQDSDSFKTESQMASENLNSSASSPTEELKDNNSKNADLKGWHNLVNKQIEEYTANRNRAREAILLGQILQQRYYNNRREVLEFNVGDKVLINQRKTNLLRSVKGLSGFANSS